MPYAIEITEPAKVQLRNLPRAAAQEVLDAIETHLSHQPTLESKSRIKFLRGKTGSPQYRLRVNQHRAYYDVDGDTVTVVAILPKNQTYGYLEGRK